MQLPPKATGDQIALLQAIAQGQAANDAEISLVLNSLNRHVAQLSQKNGKIITGIQETVLKKINQELVDNDNTIDQVSTAILARTQEWLNDNQLLLSDLSAAAGLRQPGDPLEAALIEQVSVAPDIAYSATLLLALRDAMPHFGRIVEVLREIRDRMPPQPIGVVGEAPAEAPVEAVAGSELIAPPAVATVEPEGSTETTE